MPQNDVSQILDFAKIALMSKCDATIISTASFLYPKTSKIGLNLRILIARKILHISHIDIFVLYHVRQSERESHTLFPLDVSDTKPVEIYVYTYIYILYTPRT